MEISKYHELVSSPNRLRSSCENSDTSVTISQAKYTSDILSKASITDSKTTSSLLELNVKLNTTNDEPLTDATLYRQLVGSPIYLTVTCLDLAYDVHLVVSSWLLLVPLIMLMFSVSFDTSRVRFSMAYTSLPNLLLSCVPMLM